MTHRKVVLHSALLSAILISGCADPSAGQANGITDTGPSSGSVSTNSTQNLFNQTYQLTVAPVEPPVVGVYNNCLAVFLIDAGETAYVVSGTAHLEWSSQNPDLQHLSIFLNSQNGSKQLESPTGGSPLDLEFSHINITHHDSMAVYAKVATPSVHLMDTVQLTLQFGYEGSEPQFSKAYCKF